MQATEYLLLFGSVMISGGLAFLIKNPSQTLLKLLLSFSGAFLFSITVLHLMPEVYENGGSGIGAWILLGFLIQIVLEFFSEGIEHGHMHIHHNGEGHHFPVSMMISLSLHSFMEGMPLGSIDSGNGGHEHQNGLLYGIILHHVPVAIALVSMLAGSGISKSKILLNLFLFAAMAPLGSITSQQLHQQTVQNLTQLYPYLMAVVIGIFLHISTTILFESSSNHRFHLYKMLAIVSGGVIGLLAYLN